MIDHETDIAEPSKALFELLDDEQHQLRLLKENSQNSAGQPALRENGF